MKNNIYCIYLLVLVMVSCANPERKAVDNLNLSVGEKILGKWALFIETNGEISSNKIYLQLHFYKNGTVEYRGDGILYGEDRAALFTIIENKKWYIENNQLHEEQIDCYLDKNTGDKSLKDDVEDLFRKFKRDREKGHRWVWDIKSVSTEHLILEAGNEKGGTTLLNLKKIY